jgi:FkbM family methyltransferase
MQAERGSPETYRHELQNDRWVAEVVFPRLEGGFFVEAGATNGMNGSATYFLEKRLRWQGICVEVIPWQFTRLSDVRSCKTDSRALWSVTGDYLEFSIFPQRTGRSGISQLNKNASELLAAGEEERRIDVETVTLLDLLRQHEAPPVVDYLCLDVEGAEREVLRAFEFDGPYALRAVSIEGHACDDIMESAGYRSVRNPFTDATFETYWLHPGLAR